ncbi:hypothetical protein P4V46_00005, partial [Brevibacillus borstelensis]|uniref:hypothetical protein n=1 Tax=Brevibacillus borstelensis TaxID=45462 RepID=UPI002E1EB6E8|nr:hypothetical protein [Brevibacillus borstelensis]
TKYFTDSAPGKSAARFSFGMLVQPFVTLLPAAPFFLPEKSFGKKAWTRHPVDLDGCKIASTAAKVF